MACFLPQVQSYLTAMEFAAVGRNRFGPGSEFGFADLLPFLGLPVTCSETDPNKVRHTLGFGYPALPSQKNPLPFFSLLRKFGPLRAPHNRQVEDGRPLPFKSFWAQSQTSLDRRFNCIRSSSGYKFILFDFFEVIQ